MRAVEQGDVTRLTRIPGVGRKTAERMTLELRDRLPKVDAAVLAPAAGTDGPRGDVASALVNLGYQRPAADKAVESALKDAPAAGFEDLLRRALRHLSR